MGPQPPDLRLPTHVRRHPPIVSAATWPSCHWRRRCHPWAAPVRLPRFNAPPKLAAAIRHAGYDACSVASNHSMDQGAPGVPGRWPPGQGRAAACRHGPAAPARPNQDPDRPWRPGALLSYTYGLNGSGSRERDPGWSTLNRPVSCPCQSGQAAGIPVHRRVPALGPVTARRPPRPSATWLLAACRSRRRPHRRPSRPCGAAGAAHPRQVGRVRVGELPSAQSQPVVPRHPGRRPAPGRRGQQEGPLGRGVGPLHPDLGSIPATAFARSSRRWPGQGQPSDARGAPTSLHRTTEHGTGARVAPR